MFAVGDMTLVQLQHLVEASGGWARCMDYYIIVTSSFKGINCVSQIES